MTEAMDAMVLIHLHFSAHAVKQIPTLEELNGMTQKECGGRDNEFKNMAS